MHANNVWTISAKHQESEILILVRYLASPTGYSRDRTLFLTNVAKVQRLVTTTCLHLLLTVNDGRKSSTEEE